MAFILGKNITINFPVFGKNSLSLKHRAIKVATGGAIGKDAAEITVIKALDGVSFEFREGDRVGLIGHNGSGKSTLLKVIAGIYEPVENSLQVDGNISSMLSLFLGMDMESTGLENIYMRAHLMGILPSHFKKIAEEIEEFAELGNFIDLPMRTYSSGMLMRLAFSIATCIDADIILMDEWLSVGDENFIQRAEERLEHFIDNASIVVLASHDRQLIEKKCNKIIYLEHGKVVNHTLG